MTRETFIPAKSLNILAAAWIQFQVHDWFGHGANDPSVLYDIPLDENDDWPDRNLTVSRTRPDPTWGPADSGRPPTFQCVTAHWWDGSQVYGSDLSGSIDLREGTDGRLRMTEDGLLPSGPDGIDNTGVNDNWWIGLAVMHTLFAREHNAICAALKTAYPSLTDEMLFQTARLTTAALIAKIHTVEWTPALLDTPALRFAMHTNWWGILGRSFKRRYGRVGKGEILSGIVGSAPDHHSAPFAMTEEFVSVYRMRNLLPDEFRFADADEGHDLGTEDLPGVAGRNAHALLEQHGLKNCLYSLGVEHPGAMVLRNFPRGLQRLVHSKTGRLMDLAAIDILRDRERGVPRYNMFRRLLDMQPLRRIEELTDDAELVDRLKNLYDDDPDRIDLQVGLFGEKPPPGFAFSDTAFRIFILMASRRLKSDRFFTSHFTPEVYTPVGWTGWRRTP